ncbi:hypothetical protein HDU89_004049 [Geranomyces variabilis]|nr:hypothetical protein HDU89_004049 [Geranomyces variabilis]
MSATPTNSELDRHLFEAIRNFPRLPPVRRQAALLALFHQCDPVDMSFIAKVYPRLHRDFLRLLPTTAVHTILRLCAPRDFCTIVRVSRVWFDRVNDFTLWESLYGRVGLGALVGRCYRPAEGMRGNAQRLDAFERWVRGELTCRRFRAHGSGIVALSVDGGVVVTAGVDKTIRVHNGRTGESLRTYSGHEFTCVHISGKMLVSGSADGTLRLWTSATGKLEQELPGHTGGITIVKLRGQTVVTGSTDQTLKIWLIPKMSISQAVPRDGPSSKVDRRTEQPLHTQSATDAGLAEKAICVRTLAGHETAIKCLDFAAGILVSGDISGALRLWHIASGNCLGVFTITPGAGSPTFYAFRKQENTAQKAPTASRRHDASSSVNFDGASLLFTTLSGRLFLYNVVKPAEAASYEEAREWAGAAGTFTINQALNWGCGNDEAAVDTVNSPASHILPPRSGDSIPVSRPRTPAGGGTWALCSQLDEWRIIAGGSDGSCVVWNHFTGKRVYALKGTKLIKGETGADTLTLRRSPGSEEHDSDGDKNGSIKAITGVAFDTQRIYAACMSGYIRVWDCVDGHKYF